MARVYNFSAGPSTLPEAVLERAAREMLDYNGSGQSVMEMSHRSRVYEEIIHSCEAQLRAVMQIPDDYEVLFLQGGASSQFAMVPLNLMNGSGKADYVVSGQFSKKAKDEAERYGQVRVAASSKDQNFSCVPRLTRSDFDPEADYVHICFNNTIYGTKYPYIPDTGDVPLVADMSSCILSEPMDVSRFGLIYAGAQKNMAPAGLTVVILRKDLLGYARDITPTMFRYKTHADAASMYNTPPTYPIYICKLVLDWIQNEVGGLERMKERNESKAKLLYDFLDQSSLFRPCVQGEDRSMMNVTFVTGDPELDKAFVQAAEAQGLVNLKGHRSVGGMRASIYNAMPRAGVEKLVEVMAAFEREHQPA